MTARRAVAFLLGALVLGIAGCGGGERDAGTATLWVTRDRGSAVMVDATVPAGESLLRALRSRARIGTRYGGRFVQSINGVEGSLAKRHDWFWFVNGIAGDRGAAEYRLHAGDIAWWDYRDWTHDADLAVVVGAFPEPFVHGYGGQVRRSGLVYTRPVAKQELADLSEAIHASGVFRSAVAVPRGWNVFMLVPGPTRFTARRPSQGGSTSPVELTFSGDVGTLLGGAYKRRFSVP